MRCIARAEEFEELLLVTPDLFRALPAPQSIWREDDILDMKTVVQLCRAIDDVVKARNALMRLWRWRVPGRCEKIVDGSTFSGKNSPDDLFDADEVDG